MVGNNIGGNLLMGEALTMQLTMCEVRIASFILISGRNIFTTSVLFLLLPLLLPPLLLLLLLLLILLINQNSQKRIHSLEKKGLKMSKTKDEILPVFMQIIILVDDI